MNNLYFACTDCRIYVDAGYRWAYWQLEATQLVARGQAVNIEAVLAATNFWSPPDDGNSAWLTREVFPSLREFFAAHAAHRVIFGEQEQIITTEAEHFEWMQVGYLLEPSPRYFVEVLGMRSWVEAVSYMESLESPPWWWRYRDAEPSLAEKARRKMEKLLRVPRQGCVVFQVDEVKRLIEAGRRYLTGRCSLSELNGMATECLRAAWYLRAHPAIRELARDWLDMIDRRWNEWHHRQDAVSEEEFSGWLAQQLLPWEDDTRPPH